jgi:hypothetical protein
LFFSIDKENCKILDKMEIETKAGLFAVSICSAYKMIAFNGENLRGKK